MECIELAVDIRRCCVGRGLCDEPLRLKNESLRVALALDVMGDSKLSKESREPCPENIVC